MTLRFTFAFCGMLLAAMAVSAASRLPRTSSGKPKQAPGSVPAFAKALEHFNLEIPVAEGSGVKKISTLTSQPEKSFEDYSAYCWVEDHKQLFFHVPPNGATTTGSHYPRTELSQKPAERWKPAGQSHALRGIIAVMAVPEVSGKGEMTLAQIHTDNSDHGPLLRLVCDYKSKPWKLHAEYRTEPTKGSEILDTPKPKRETIKAGEDMDYEIVLKDSVLTVKVRKSGTKTWSVLADSTEKGHSLNAAWLGETCYFKAGCYMFDPGSSDEPAAEVRCTMLAVD